MKIFVVGARGLVGGKATRLLLEEHHTVGVLVRTEAAAHALRQAGARAFIGDLKDRASIERALTAFGHADALLTTAYGYGRRQPGDSLRSVDDEGNRNLVDAAQRAGVSRFVFTSILTADRAQSVPHFHQKYRTEEYLAKSGLPWVALRPGGFLDTLLGLNIAGIRKGKLTVPTNLDAPASTILSDDVARYLARAATIDGALPPRVDLGMQQPTNIREIAAELSAALGRTITASAPPAFVRTVVFRVLGMFDRSLRENLKAMEYVASGQYVADTTQQARLFGPPPTLRASIRHWLKSANLGASS